MPGKLVALIGAACLTTGWLLASLLTPPVARVQTLRERRPPAATAATNPAQFAEQSQLRLEQAAAPPTPPTRRRNPFFFGGRQTPSERDGAQQEPLVPAFEMTPATLPARPAYSLSGIGVTGDDRTAVLTDGTSVTLVKVGDAVGGYQVLDITDTSVTLAASSGERRILRLR